MPAVDLVIAVHSANRPIERAVASAAKSGIAVGQANGLRITVVCHNIDVEEIRVRIPAELRDTVRYLPCVDGIPSPAGPFNAGIAAATGRYTSIMGSDDFLEDGAIAGWLSIAEQNNSDVVLAPERHASGALVRTPPVRVWRRMNLNPVRDRLSYRTAPLGLIRTSEISRLGLRFTSSYRSGEDQEFSSKLYFGGGRIDYGKGAGHYVVGADATDRVTSDLRPIAEDFRFATDLVALPWFSTLPSAGKNSIVTKLLRVHIFGVAGSRPASAWTSEQRQELATVVATLTKAAPKATSPLSVADAKLLRAAADPSVCSTDLEALAVARKKFGHPATLIATDWRSQFAVEGPLRFMAASALL